MKNTTEYIVTELTENSGWCLFCLAGYCATYAKKTLEQCQKKYPNKQLRIEATNYNNNWWNKYGTN